jgi:prepilin-type N-terminal cleavage/methylation domain-containing protein
MLGKIICFNFIFSEESLPVTIRSPKHHDRGFTLVEMLVVVAIVGILIGIATPSLLALNKPLREGTSQFKTQLNLIRSKAIASGQAYRIRPKYSTAAGYPKQIPGSFIVEYAANCRVTTIGQGTATTPDGWMRASQLDLDLSSVGIAGTTKVGGTDTTAGSVNYTLANGGSTLTITSEANLNWNICYDNRGIASNSVDLTLKDFQGNNRAKTATISVQVLGAATISAKDSSGTATHAANENPVF